MRERKQRVIGRRDKMTLENNMTMEELAELQEGMQAMYERFHTVEEIAAEFNTTEQVTEELITKKKHIEYQKTLDDITNYLFQAHEVGLVRTEVFMEVVNLTKELEKKLEGISGEITIEDIDIEDVPF